MTGVILQLASIHLLPIIAFDLVVQALQVLLVPHLSRDYETNPTLLIILQPLATQWMSPQTTLHMVVHVHLSPLVTTMIDQVMVQAPLLLPLQGIGTTLMPGKHTQGTSDDQWIQGHSLLIVELHLSIVDPTIGTIDDTVPDLKKVASPGHGRSDLHLEYVHPAEVCWNMTEPIYSCSLFHICSI